VSEMFVPADEATREEIRTQIDMSMCVEAGAGTGKTTVLVDRVVELLSRGPHGVDDIAVMTFTDAAAAELAARVREKLETALAASSEPSERTRLENALLGLYRAQIATIHAFATNILRERPVEARLDPRFTVLDPLGAAQRFDESWREWLDETLASEVPQISTAINRGLDVKQMRVIAEAVHAHRYLLPLTHQAPPSPDIDGFAAMLEQCAAELDQLRSSCIEESDGAHENAGELIEFAAQYRDAQPSERERLIMFRAPQPKLNVGKQGNWQPAADCARTKQLLRDYREHLQEIGDSLRLDALAGVLPLIEAFVRDHEHKRRADGEAEYDDLLIWARNLLRDDLEVRSYFQERFPRIFVDEFQDTDPLQAEIVMYIAAGSDGHGDWRHLQPGAGRLFIVGDPKQSIYRFRRADIRVYDEVKSGPLEGTVKAIVQNFRSHPEIIGWANTVFDRLLIEEPGVQPGNVALKPLLSGVDAGRPPIVVVHGTRADVTPTEARKEEAQILAEMIRRAVQDEHWPVRDRRSGAERAVQWRDIAILMPARTDVEHYTDALAAADIPHRLEGSRTFYVRQEVRDVIACLRAIDDPLDHVSLIGALRSRACGCSDEELFLWREHDGGLDLRVDPPEIEPQTVKDALDMLVGLRRARRSLSLPELVRAVLRETGLVELALSEKHGEQGAANLLKLAEQAQAFAGSGGGLRAFTRWLGEQRDEESEEQEAGSVEEVDDVVRLVTVHSAKGLEYPIVALANLNRKIPTNRKRSIPDAESARLHLSIGQGSDGDGRFETVGYADAEEAENRMIDAEALRLLYVAATRARDHMIIPVAGPEGKENGMLEWLLPDLPHPDSGEQCPDGCFLYELDDLPERPEAEREPPAGKQAVNAALEAREHWQTEQEHMLGTARRERTIVTATSTERLWTRPLTVEVTEGEGAIVATGEGAPLPLGDALHRVMEFVDLNNPSDLQGLVAAVAHESALTDREDELLALGNACLASPTVKLAAISDACWREVPFGIVDADDALTFGRMDLIYREDDRLVIVDYKTDMVPNGVSVAVQGHRGQAEVYARAAKAATGLDVDRVVFVFARAGGAEAAIPKAELSSPEGD
jgi:ATP-dependent helicase/nuclease subunit A